MHKKLINEKTVIQTQLERFFLSLFTKKELTHQAKRTL